MAAVPSARVAVTPTEWATVSNGADTVYLQVLTTGSVRIVFGATAPMSEDPDASFVISKEDGIVKFDGLGNETKIFAMALLRASVVAVIAITPGV